jgi:hypothetical protein
MLCKEARTSPCAVKRQNKIPAFRTGEGPKFA